MRTRVCRICGRSFETWEDLMKHAVKEHPISVLFWIMQEYKEATIFHGLIGFASGLLFGMVYTTYAFTIRVIPLVTPETATQMQETVRVFPYVMLLILVVVGIFVSGAYKRHSAIRYVVNQMIKEVKERE